MTADREFNFDRLRDEPVANGAIQVIWCQVCWCLTGIKSADGVINGDPDAHTLWHMQRGELPASTLPPAGDKS